MGQPCATFAPACAGWRKGDAGLRKVAQACAEWRKRGADLRKVAQTRRRAAQLCATIAQPCAGWGRPFCNLHQVCVILCRSLPQPDADQMNTIIVKVWVPSQVSKKSLM